MRFGKGFRAMSLSLSLLLPVTAAGGTAAAYSETVRSEDGTGSSMEESGTGDTEEKEQESSLASKVISINNQIITIQEELFDLDRSIEEKQKEVDEAKAGLQSKKEKTGKQNEQLELRLRTMYKSGEIGLLEVLLDSADLTELLSNLGMIQKIYDNDSKLMKQMKQQYKQIEEDGKKLTVLGEELSGQQNKKKSEEKELSGRISELEELETRVESDPKALSAQIDEMNRESAKLTEELQSQELIASSSSDSVYEGGALLWPVPSYQEISSRYGYQLQPVLNENRLHTGIDLTAEIGSPILAASNGQVIYASVRGGYGFCVIIDHGGGIVTLYGHCSRLLVVVGQSVVRGQEIAFTGNTGLSTGPHCHFEVRVNGSAADPLSYLDLTGIVLPETLPESSGSQSDSLPVQDDGSAFTEEGSTDSLAVSETNGETGDTAGGSEEGSVGEMTDTEEAG